MWKDPIVEEVRKARKLLENEFGPKAEDLLRHIYSQQKKIKGKLISRSPKKISIRKAA